jgi:hypothetical protein
MICHFEMKGGWWIRSLRSLGWWMELMVDGGHAHFVRLDSGGSIVISSQVPGKEIHNLELIDGYCRQFS